MAATSKAKAVKAAKTLLAKHGIAEAPVDLNFIGEQEGLTFEWVDLEDDVPGFLLMSRENVYVTVNKNHAPARQRFMIAHAFAHYLMPPDEVGVYIYDLLMYFRGAGTKAVSLPDPVGNAFAMELLMPSEFLRVDLAGRRVDMNDDVAVRLLAQRYQVSTAVLAIRLVELGMERGVGGR